MRGGDIIYKYQSASLDTIIGTRVCNAGHGLANVERISGIVAKLLSYALRHCQKTGHTLATEQTDN
jgi:hypothetical protein